MWVCLCRAVTSATILSVIDEGATTVREISEASGAATDCTKCTLTIRTLLEQHGTAAEPGRPGGQR